MVMSWFYLLNLYLILLHSLVAGYNKVQVLALTTTTLWFEIQRLLSFSSIWLDRSVWLDCYFGMVSGDLVPSAMSCKFYFVVHIKYSACKINLEHATNSKLILVFRIFATSYCLHDVRNIGEFHH